MNPATPGNSANPTLLWATAESPGRDTHTQTRTLSNDWVVLLQWDENSEWAHEPWSCDESSGMHCGNVLLDRRSGQRRLLCQCVCKEAPDSSTGLVTSEEIRFFWCSTDYIWPVKNIYLLTEIKEISTANTDKVRALHWWPSYKPWYDRMKEHAFLWPDSYGNTEEVAAVVRNTETVEHKMWVNLFPVLSDTRGWKGKTRTHNFRCKTNNIHFICILITHQLHSLVGFST